MKLLISHCPEFLSVGLAVQAAFTEQATRHANLEVFHAMVA